jgi:hypothetical protein
MSTRAERERYAREHAERMAHKDEERRVRRDAERAERGLPPHRGWRDNFDDANFWVVPWLWWTVALLVLDSLTVRVGIAWPVLGGILLTALTVVLVRWDDERRAAPETQQSVTETEIESS